MKTPALLSSFPVPAPFVGLILLMAALAGCSPKAPAHGTSFTLAFNPTTNPPVTADLRSATENALRARLQQLGVKAYLDPAIDPHFRILVPPMSANELAAVRAAITKPGILAFRLVHAESTDLISQGQDAPGYELLKLKVRRSGGSEEMESLLVKRVAEQGLSGAIVKSAYSSRGPLGEPEISFELTPAAAAAFAQVTRDNIGRRLAIIIDGEIFSAPVINSEIPGGRGQVTGQFTDSEAGALVNAMTSPLPAQVHVIEEKTY